MVTLSFVNLDPFQTREELPSSLGCLTSPTGLSDITGSTRPRGTAIVKQLLER